jgi:hypothetical protein
VAFAITGFVGASLVMYAWLCALVIALQASIFRHSSMRTRLVATLVVTAIAIVAVAFVRFGNVLASVLPTSSGQPSTSAPGAPAGPSLAQRLEASPWTYTVINFGLLLIFWIDTVRRWIRRARGLPPTERVALNADEARQDAAHRAQVMPSMEELVSGDLIAGAVLAIALSFLFQIDVLRLATQHISSYPTVASCAVALPASYTSLSCTGAAASLTTTLSFIDRIQALVYFPLGLIILALTAVLSGLGAAGGVDGASRPAVERAATTGRGTSRGSAAVAEDVTTTVMKTLRSAVDRRIRHLIRNLALSLRTVAWPALIVLAVLGVSEVSTDLAAYLASDKSLINALTLMGPGVVWGVGAALALAFSAALVVFRWRVADNTLRFLGLIGFVLLLTFWMFSLALAGFNYLLNYTGITQVHPFWPLGVTTFGSLAALVIWGAIALVRRSQAANGAGPSVASGAESGALVEAQVDGTRGANE